MSKLTWPRAVVLVLFIIASTAFFLWARQQGEAKASRVSTPVSLKKRASTQRPQSHQLLSVDGDGDGDGDFDDAEPVADPQLDPLPSPTADVTPRPRAKPKMRERTSGLVRLAAELLREFPQVPDELKARCASSDRGGVVDLACQDGVDALVDYQLAKNGTWKTLTILGPQGTNNRAACRDWLVRNAPGAKPFGTRQRNDELQMYFVRGDTRFMASFLTMPRRDSGALCSVMACLEDGKGNGAACREPID